MCAKEEFEGLFAEVRNRLRVGQCSARGSVKLFFSPCTKCPALSRRTDIAYAPVPRRRNESTDLDSIYGVPACGKSFRVKKTVSPHPPSIGNGCYTVLFLLSGRGGIRADLLDFGIYKGTSNVVNLETASVAASVPAAGTVPSHKWCFGVLR